MRIYIIGNDGITLCREAPVTVNQGEIAVASKEELTASGPPRDAENLEHRLWADRHVIPHEFAKRSFGAHHRPPARRDQFRERLLDPEQCQDMARSALTVQ